MCFQIDWASRKVGSKFTVFALLYFVFEGSFPSTTSRGAYIWRGDLTEGFCVTALGGLYLEGFIHRGAYFRNFTVFDALLCTSKYRLQNCKWAFSIGELSEYLKSDLTKIPQTSLL